MKSKTVKVQQVVFYWWGIFFLLLQKRNNFFARVGRKKTLFLMKLRKPKSNEAQQVDDKQ